jgi:hypothetical protein
MQRLSLACLCFIIFLLSSFTSVWLEWEMRSKPAPADLLFILGLGFLIAAVCAAGTLFAGAFSNRDLGIKRNGVAHLSVTAQHVCKLHLTRRATFRREKSWAADHNTRAAST